MNKKLGIFIELKLAYSNRLEALKELLDRNPKLADMIYRI